MPFQYCLNTSTVRECGLSLPETIDLAADAGYQGIEPWVRELDAFVDGGGALVDIAAQLRDRGLAVPNLIGFFEWGVPEDELRRKGLEEARRNLDIAAQLGCKGLAAAPMGMVDRTGVDLVGVAERYGRLIEIGREYGVTPILEFWGMSKTLSRLGEALLVAAECGQPGACILADVFHMYKGSGCFEGLRLLGPDTLALLHVNDYPARPPRTEIVDADRVFPGDGTAPLGAILRTLAEVGYDGMLSLELFNESYWQRDARWIVETGLEKTKRAVEAALA